MSTLGGNKGGEREKNPNKPKFAALDINSLYRTSRGEQFEQTTQKNAPPRKHGMQILGKVPSARRPANLPSLKAETSTPINTPPQQPTEQQTNSSSSASWADSSGATNNQQPSIGTTSSNNININNNNNNNSASSAPHNLQATNSSGSSSSWSAVATGVIVKEEPPLYQSPQFQNEFPSLGDGGTLSSTTSNVNANAMKTNTQNQNSFDSGGGMNLSLRPSTDAASWMQQQQQMGSANSGSARGAGNENGNQSNFPPADLDGPPKVMALMPSFLRGGNVGIGNISSGGNNNQMNLQKPRDGRDNRDNRGGRYERSYNNDYVNNNMPPPRHRQSTQPPRLAGRQQQQQQQQQYNNSNNEDRSSSYEPETTVVIQQRPIIREEELDRIDSLARDDAWSRHDEIDYNKKLQFSDDEPEDLKPKDMKSDAWRERDSKMSHQQNGPRSLDPLYVEKMKMVREEEDRKERERKLAAQRKLQELDDKTKQQKSEVVIEEKTSSGIGYIINDADKRSDYGKSKYINSEKYDSYESYGRRNDRGPNERDLSGSGAAGGEFKKSSFQSNLPPRFQKQHQHIDERRGPLDKRPLHQQDSKNIPFAQHPPYEQRWPQYNKNQAPNQAPRRNMSSLSQSSSDDNPRNGGGGPNKPYNRRRQESEEDDYGRYIKDSKPQQQQQAPLQKPHSSTTLATAQISRSMSDSSDKLSDHNRSEKSTSREYLGTNVCWAEVCENDKRPTSLEPTSSVSKDRRRVSESSAMSDDQPRTILQRNKPLQEQLPTVASKEKDLSMEDEKKTVLNDVPSKTTLSSTSEVEKKEKAEDKKSLEIIPEKEASKGSSEKTDENKEKKEGKETDDLRHNKRSPRYDARDGRDSRGGRGGYNANSNYRGNNWNRRGGPHSGRGNRYDYSDSENSEDEWNRGKNANRKDLHHRRDTFAQKEGFSPRGEPSRRGRGASSSGSSGFHRSSINAPVKRIDNYGPPSSKSPFGSNDEKSSSEKKHETTPQKEQQLTKEKLSDDDRIKQKQKALSDGLMNKNLKDNSNVALQKSSSPGKSSEDSSMSKHSTEVSAFSSAAADHKDKKLSEDDKASIDSKGRSSYSSGTRRNDKNVSQINKAVSKPSATSNVPQSSSHYTSSSMSKPQDSRNNSNNNYRDSRDPRFAQRDPRFSNKNVPGSNRMGNNSNYWDKNSESMQDDSKMFNPTSQQVIANQQMSQNVLKTDNVQMQQGNQAMLDGASLPKTTLIFENTSLRSGPPQQSQQQPTNVAPPQMKRPPPQQMQKEVTINEMIEQQTKDQSLTSALQSLSFGSQSGGANSQQKSDMVDMNAFKFSFDTQIGQLTDDSSFVQSTAAHQSQSKTSSSLGLVGAKTGGSNILNTDSLNLKVASCKKVWEDPSVDHTVTSTNEDVMANFVAQQHLQQYNNITAHHTGLSPQSFGYNTGSSNDHSSSLDQHFVSKSNDNDDGSSYPSPQQHMNAHVMHSQSQQANLNMKAAEAFATNNANVCKVKPTQMHQSGLSPPPQIQQNMQHQQTFYQTPNYPNMSTIPSPPVVYNSQATGGLYSYNMDAARAQMYGYQASGANNSLSFNAFMQTPNIASAPTHEVYQNLSQYRATVQPFNQTPQLNNPNAVLISSATATSNSMMGSKSNTPQQIGAIGSKTSGPPPQTPAAAGQYNQQYLNHLYHQQHANSYYPNSTAQQANPYYNSSGSAATGSYGMFGGTNGQQQMPNYGSVGQFPLNSQMLNNLVLNQQYRGGPVVAGSNNGASGSNTSGSNTGSVSGGSSGYMKQQHQSQLQDPWDSSSSSASAGRAYTQSQNQQFPAPIQRPSMQSTHGGNPHYQQQQQQRSKSNNAMMSTGSKSQFFNNTHMNSSKREN